MINLEKRNYNLRKGGIRRSRDVSSMQKLSFNWFGLISCFIPNRKRSYCCLPFPNYIPERPTVLPIR